MLSVFVEREHSYRVIWGSEQEAQSKFDLAQMVAKVLRLDWAEKVGGPYEIEMTIRHPTPTSPDRIEVKDA